MSSRIEDILQAIINGTGTSDLPVPQSRNEALLIAIANKISELEILASKLPIVILVSGEYDPQTGVPTILNPKTDTFYLVPSGTGTDLYEEWVYTGSAWEHFGAGGSVVIPQSDWSQSDSSARDYIKNKPGIVSIADGTDGLTITLP